MKFEQINRDDQQVQITAELDEAIMDQFKQRAARKISRESKIPGFRPGKAPYNVVLRLYGNDTIEKEATDLLIEDVYPRIVDEAKIKPSGPGTLEKIISTHPPKFTFLIPLEPEIKLGGYKAVRQAYSLPKVKESEVDEYLNRMRTSYATAEPVDRPAEKGDLVYLKVNGILQDPRGDEDAVVFKEVPSQVLLGDAGFQENDFPFEGFADQINGLKAGQEKEIVHTFPPAYGNEKLQGRTVNLKVAVQGVKVMKLPELDETFAKMVGNFDSMDALRKAVRGQMELTARQQYERKYFDDVIGKMQADAQVKYPPQMLDHEVEHVLESIEKDLATQKLDLPAYLKSVQKDKAKFIEEDVKPIARKRLERSLLLEELARLEEIKLDKEELNQAFQQTVQELQLTTDFQKLQRKMEPDRLSNAIAVQAANRLLNDRVLDRIKAIANGEIEKPIKKEKKEASSKPSGSAVSRKAAGQKPAVKKVEETVKAAE